MPTPTVDKTEVLDRLMDSFRSYGYDGASLAALSKRTGLGKSSLYHHFPGGKEQMALDVLRHLNAGFGEIYEAVRAECDPERKLELMLDSIDAFYGGGKRACLLERLAASVDRERFGAPLKSTFAGWMGALADVCRAAGLDEDVARRRAEDAVVRVEGALVVAAGVGDTGVFRRTLDDLRATLLA